MKNIVILNSGLGAWAFQGLADKLAQDLELKIPETPGDYNYVLGWDENNLKFGDKSFVPFKAMKLASDRRLLAKVFERNNIFTPETHLLDNYRDVTNFIGDELGK